MPYGLGLSCLEAKRGRHEFVLSDDPIDAHAVVDSMVALLFRRDGKKKEII